MEKTVATTNYASIVKSDVNGATNFALPIFVTLRILSECKARLYTLLTKGYHNLIQLSWPNIVSAIKSTSVGVRFV